MWFDDLVQNAQNAQEVKAAIVLGKKIPVFITYGQRSPSNSVLVTIGPLELLLKAKCQPQTLCSVCVGSCKYFGRHLSHVAAESVD